MEKKQLKLTNNDPKNLTVKTDVKSGASFNPHRITLNSFLSPSRIIAGTGCCVRG